MSSALAVVDGGTIHKTQTAADLYRHASDVAGVCGEIVKKTAQAIQGRKYVKVEGWQAIAAAYGCVASSKDVQKVDGGFRSTGEVRRVADGVLLATAEGFVGEDEPVWYGGGWNKKTNAPYENRPEYAKRAMAQTRAISRACRSAFAFVVVMIDSELSTTPAEEVPDGGFVDVRPSTSLPAPAGVDRLREQLQASNKPSAAPSDARKHEDISFKFGNEKGIPLSKMSENGLTFYAMALRRDIASTDPDKVKWAEKSKAGLKAVVSEQEYREERRLNEAQAR